MKSVIMNSRLFIADFKNKAQNSYEQPCPGAGPRGSPGASFMASNGADREFGAVLESPIIFSERFVHVHSQPCSVHQDCYRECCHLHVTYMFLLKFLNI